MLNLDSALGIVVRADRLVLATVKKGFQDYWVKNLAVIENYPALTPPELNNAVRQYVRSNSFNRENVILGIPREQAVYRYLRLPLEVEENLEQVVRFQVEKYEPSEEQRSYYDYLVLDRDQEKKQILLGLVMVRRSLVDEYLDLFQRLGLYPAAIRVCSVALHHALMLNPEVQAAKRPVVVLNLEPGFAEILVLHGRDRFFSEALPQSRERWDVEELLNEVGLYLSRLDLQVEEIAKLYLAGSLASELLEEFRNRVGDCELVTSRLQGRLRADSGRITPEWVEPLGLALSSLSRLNSSRLNLIPVARRLVGERPRLVPTAVLAGLFFLLLVALGARDYFQNTQLLREIDLQLQQLQPQVNEVMAIREQAEQRRAQLEELRKMMTGRHKILVVLKDLTERIPDHTFLQLLQVQGDRLSMQGYSDSASGLLPLLLNSQYLASVESNWITPDPTVQGKEKFNFAATIKEQP